MINNINTSGRHIIVHNSGGSGPYISPGAVGAGMMRWNANMNQMEVNDGNSWVPFSHGHATIELTPDTESLLAWARTERDRQMKRERLINSNAALKKAWEAIQRAEANFDILEKFVENDEDSSVQSSP
jgi:hypothetical protein